MGKSGIACDLAARIARGLPWSDGARGVIHNETEDGVDIPLALLALPCEGPPMSLQERRHVSQVWPQFRGSEAPAIAP